MRMPTLHRVFCQMVCVVALPAFFFFLYDMNFQWSFLACDQVMATVCEELLPDSIMLIYLSAAG